MEQIFKETQKILWKINDKMISCLQMEDSFVRETAAIQAMEEYGKQQWNDAIEAAAENADWDCDINHENIYVDKQSILKLKK